MAAEGSTRAVVTALAANLGIAVSKFVAAAITGSASMLAEGVHSVADSGNQVLLLVGGRRSQQAPSALHPFGYARARYIYAFLVAIVLFTLGGLYALFEGYHQVLDPHPLTSPLVAVAVLLVAAVSAAADDAGRQTRARSASTSSTMAQLRSLAPTGGELADQLAGHAGESGRPNPVGQDVEMQVAERPLGVFSRQLFLGDTLDGDDITASYDAGVLTLRIPVAEQAKPRRIEISNADKGVRQIDP